MEQITSENHQYLTFKIDNELFGLNIIYLKEILYLKNMTSIPNTPPFLLGVINLRGHVVSIIDLRIKFGFATTEHTVDTTIIILEVNLNGKIELIGALVDSVEEVLQFEENQLNSPPNMGTRLKAEFIKSIAHFENEWVILLNLEIVFSLKELSFKTDKMTQ